MSKMREPGMDNLRGGLMLLVVLGHLLEHCGDFFGRDSLYVLLYSFHMPAFLFLSGYFARFRPGKIFWGTVWPYLIFQPVYLFFMGWLTGSPVTLQFRTPYWILWYLMVLFYCQVLIPLYDRKTAWGKGLVLAAAVGLALGCGYWTSVGYEWSLSRFLVFQVWFILGFYWKNGGWSLRLEKLRLPLGLGFGAIAAAAGLAVVLMPIPGVMLYGSYPYALGYGPGIRAVSMAAALGAIGVMMLLVLPRLNRPIPGLTALGQNTLPVFLLHGFAVRLIENLWPGLTATPLRTAAVTVGLALALGNPLAGRALGTLMPDKWWRASRNGRKEK